MPMSKRRHYKDGIHKRGRMCWISFQDRHGKQVRESSGSTRRSDAEKLLTKRKAEVMSGRWQAPRETPYLSEFIDTFLSWVPHLPTRERYGFSLKKLSGFLGRLRLAEITSKDLYEYQQYRLQKGISPASINRDLATLHRLFSLAGKRGFFEGENPCGRVERLPETNTRRTLLPFTRDEEARVVEVATGWFRVLFIVLIEMGLRVGKEALPLKWTDVEVDSEPGYLLVRASKTKAGIRTLWLTEYCQKTLKEWRDLTGPSFSEYVFANPQDPTGHITDYKTPWRSIRKKVGMTEHVLYDTRATAASRANALAPNPLTVAQFLGHSSTSILPTYARPLDENTKAILRGLDAARKEHEKKQAHQRTQ